MTIFTALLAASLSANPNPILHLRADTGLILDAAGNVAVWKDLSPRHTDFGTSTLGRPQAVFVTANFDTAEKRVYKTLDSDSLLRPKPVRRGIGGLPSVRFDGFQTLVDTTSLPLDSGFTLFIVAQDSSGKGVASAMLDKGPGDFGTNLWNGVDGNFQIGLGWTTNIAQSPLETAAPTLYESRWNGYTANLWANGVFQSSGSTNSTPTRAKRTWLGGTFNPHSMLQGFLKGLISEVIVFPEGLDSLARKDIEASLLARYGLVTPKDRRILHLRADTGVVLDGNGKIALWRDMSPRHTDFGTSTLGKPQLVLVTANFDTAEKRIYKTLDSDSLLRPGLVQNGPGGHPAVRFDGMQTLVDTTGLPLDSGYTLFIVAQDSSGKGVASALLDKGPGDFGTNLWNGIDGNFQVGLGWVANLAKSPLETTATTLYESSWNGHVAKLWANGIFQDSGTWSTQVNRARKTWLGGTLNPHNMLQGFLTGQVSEVLVYRGELDSVERQSIESDLLHRYVFQLAPAGNRQQVRESSQARVLQTASSLSVFLVGNGRITFRGMDGRLLSATEAVNGKATMARPTAMGVLTIHFADGRSEARVIAPLR